MQCIGGGNISKSRLSILRLINKNVFNNKYDLSDLSFIAKDYKKVLDFIDKRGLKQSTALMYKFAVVTFIRVSGNIKLADELSVKLCEEQKIMNSKNESNIKTSKNFGTWEQFINKLSDNEKKYKNATTLKAHYNFLIMAVYTYAFPIRYEWRDVSYSKSTKSSWFDIKNKTLHLIEYKKHAPYTFTIKNKLYDILVDSFKRYPREYIFCELKNREEHMSVDTFKRLLNSQGFKGIDNVRSMRVSYEYAKNPTLKQKKQLAMAMRTSVDVMDQYYNKIDGGNDKELDPEE